MHTVFVRFRTIFFNQFHQFVRNKHIACIGCNLHCQLNHTCIISQNAHFQEGLHQIYVHVFEEE